MRISIPIIMFGYKTRLIGGIFLLILALLFMTNMGFALNSNLAIQRDYKEVEVVVKSVDIEVEKWTDSDGNERSRQVFDLTVDYEVDGEKYENVPVDNYNTYAREGDKLVFYYEVSNPANLRGYGASFTSTIVQGALAAVCGAISVFCFVSYAKEKIKRVTHEV